MTRLLRPNALTSSENRRRRNGRRLRARDRCRRFAPRRDGSLVPLRSGRRGAGILAGCPFVARCTTQHSTRLASSTWERLTRSRSPTDRKPSPLRPSGFYRSLSYCHHDKHTRPLQPSSRTTFRADRVATLPVGTVVAAMPDSLSTADDRSTDEAPSIFEAARLDR